MGTATPESQLATLLKEGRAGGFGPLRSEACLRLLAQLDQEAHRNAWFDQFYELYGTQSHAGGLTQALQAHPPCPHDGLPVT